MNYGSYTSLLETGVQELLINLIFIRYDSGVLRHGYTPAVVLQFKFETVGGIAKF